MAIYTDAATVNALARGIREDRLRNPRHRRPGNPDDTPYYPTPSDPYSGTLKGAKHRRPEWSKS